MEIPFLKPDIRSSDINAAVKVLKSGWITRSPVSIEFEKNFSKYFGSDRHTVTMNSGTAPMHVALLALGIGPGDEVIVPAISYVATSNVVLYVGAKPIFVDIDSKTGLMDLDEVEKKITKKTKAIIPVHLYGQMIDMKRLATIAKKHDIQIIEDACHAIEAARDGVRPGDLSYAASFSFHAAKNLSAGEGGALVVRDHELAERCHVLADSGVKKGNNTRRALELGYKYSFTSFQCALLIGQLKRINENWKKRKKIYETYENACAKISGVTYAARNKSHKHGHHMFVIFVDPSKRDVIREYMRNKGVQTAIHYDPIPLEPYYVNRFKFKKGDFPNAEKWGFGAITLPLYPSLTTKAQTQVIKMVEEAIKKV